MRTKTIELFQLDELDDSAKEKAREWYREISAGDNFFAEYVIDDFKEAAKACGLDIGGTNPNNSGDDGLYWSGFSSQGDGASFSASWSARDVNVESLIENRPAETKLHKIALGFAGLADLDRTASGMTKAGRGHWQTDTSYSADETDCETDLERGGCLKELCTDLADWFYRTLEEACEYQNSDEAIDETIQANGYEFTTAGKPA